MAYNQGKLERQYSPRESLLNNSCSLKYPSHQRLYHVMGGYRLWKRGNPVDLDWNGPIAVPLAKRTKKTFVVNSRISLLGLEAIAWPKAKPPQAPGWSLQRSNSLRHLSNCSWVARPSVIAAAITSGIRTSR